MVFTYATSFNESPKHSEEHVSFSNTMEIDESEMNKNLDVERISSESHPTRGLFVDPDFPANNFSLFSMVDTTTEEVEWKRPGEIVETPRFIAEGFSRFDVRQGRVGDCWFLSTCASLATVPELFEQVVPRDNVEFQDANYQGKFHFRFWQYGQWVDVFVDDRLPVGENGQLLYGKSSTEDEFWSALLEKAYAKLHGSYESLDSGTGSEAMVDLSGGITEYYNLKDVDPSKLFRIVETNLKRGCLITTGTITNPDLKAVNLVELHEYTVTNAIKLAKNKVQLICIRNPWGRVEWQASWSDKSREWKTVSKEKMKQHNIVKDDGEFWMDIVDFMHYFDDITMCHQPPIGCDVPQKRTEGCWKKVDQHGAWVSGSTAGGSEQSNFWRNPQYLITLEEHIANEVENEDNEGNNNSGKKCKIVIGLMQKHHRATGRIVPMSFSIFPVPEDADLTQRPLPKSFFDDAIPMIEYPALEAAREIVHRDFLPAGKYVLVPNTWKPKQEAEFFVRVFSLGAIAMQCIDQPIAVQTPIDLDAERTRVSKDLLYEIFMMNNGRKIGCNDLQMILLRVFNLKLGKTSCSALVHLYGEQDGQGTVHHGQLIALLQDVAMWTSVFKTCDANTDGTLDIWELRNAFQAGGTHINQHILNTIVRSHGSGHLTLSEFVVCAIKTRKIIEHFSRHHLEQQGMVNHFSSIYAHINNIAIYHYYMGYP